MRTNKFTITIHMVASLDGMIAKKDNSVSWFETSHPYEKGIAEDDTAEFLKNIDCYVMGSRTFEHAVELSKSYGWAYGDTPTIVLTHRPLTTDRPNIEFYTGDLNTLVNERLRPRYQHVWIAGGAVLTRDFLRSHLADQIRISILPIILGEGRPFFDHIGREQLLHLKNTAAYKNGMVELQYEVVKQ